MDRRWMFKWAAAGAGLASLVATARAQENKKLHKIVLHVGFNSEESMKTALNNAKNAYEVYSKLGEEVTMEIVANSGGLHMLRDDTSPVKEQIRELLKLDPKVALSACNNTKTGMEKKEGKPVPIISEARVVPAGIVRLAELQEQGFAYVRP